MTLTIGIDDAGRGPLIGGMYLAGILVDKNAETALKKYDIRDSKTLYQSQRVKLAKIIKQTALTYKVVKSTPIQIDTALATGTNLNKLEAIKTAEIINNLNNNKSKIKVIIDCPSVNTVAWRNTLLDYVKNPKNLNVKCEHKADVNYIEVSAASILAKCAREEEVAQLKKKYGNIGSGYPSDPDTKEFLKSHGKKHKESGIFRKSWQTWKKQFPDAKQSTLF